MNLHTIPLNLHNEHQSEGWHVLNAFWIVGIVISALQTLFHLMLSKSQEVDIMILSILFVKMFRLTENIWTLPVSRGDRMWIQISLAIIKPFPGVSDDLIPESEISLGERNGNWRKFSSILAWRISWTEKPDGLQSMGSQSQTLLSN